MRVGCSLGDKRSPALKTVTYTSVDIETLGPAPGLHSMISLGAAAFNETGDLLDSQQWNLLPIPGTEPDPKTSKFWMAQPPEILQRATENALDPAVAMPLFNAWCRSFPGHKICIAWPAAWDYAFVFHYLIRFVGNSPFGHSALDIKSLLFALTGQFRSKKHLPQKVRTELTNRPHTHVAVEDAIEQGEIFFALKRRLEVLRIENQNVTSLLTNGRNPRVTASPDTQGG